MSSRGKGPDSWNTFNQSSRGCFLGKAKGYFTKELGADFPSDTLEWHKIENYRLLRNCIVHRGSRLRDKVDEQLRKYVEGSNGPRCRGSDVHLEKEFCYEAGENIKSFFRQLKKSFWARVVDALEEQTLEVVP